MVGDQIQNNEFWKRIQYKRRALILEPEIFTFSGRPSKRKLKPETACSAELCS